MSGKPKTAKTPGFMRSVLAGNLTALVQRDYASLTNMTQRLLAIEKATGISLSTLQRILSEKVGASLDTIETLAEHFDVQVYQLMLTNLDVKNPQVVQGASIAERKAYRRWQRGSKEPTKS